MTFSKNGRNGFRRIGRQLADHSQTFKSHISFTVGKILIFGNNKIIIEIMYLLAFLILPVTKRQISIGDIYLCRITIFNLLATHPAIFKDVEI